MIPSIDIKFSEEFNNIITAAISNETETLVDLLKNRAINASEHGFTPALFLAINNHVGACKLLIERFGARKKDMLYGLYWRDHHPSLDNSSNFKSSDFNSVAAYAASNGNCDLAFTILNDHRNTDPNYNGVAMRTAQNGHTGAALKIFNHPNNRNKRYNRIAAKAAHLGLKNFALALLRHPNNTKPRYDLAAIAAINGGQANLTLEILDDKNNQIPDYNEAAAYAANAGLTSLTLSLLMHEDNLDPDYHWAATAAAEGNHAALHATLLMYIRYDEKAEQNNDENAFYNGEDASDSDDEDLAQRIEVLKLNLPHPIDALQPQPQPVVSLSPAPYMISTPFTVPNGKRAFEAPSTPQFEPKEKKNKRKK